MTDDLVKRLRMDIEPSEGDMEAAADRIEELERSRQHWQDCYTRKVQHELEVRARVEALEAALLEADQFITNGIELGYIRMPDADVPDAAHHIPGNIRAALAGEKKDG